MNMDLRQAIKHRVSNKSEEELREIIEDSVGREERALPGLGVLFEIIWQHCDNTTKQTMVTALKENISV